MRLKTFLRCGALLLCGLFAFAGCGGTEDKREDEDMPVVEYPDYDYSEYSLAAYTSPIWAGERVGTRFEAPAGAPHEGGRKLWIGLAEVPRGSISLDAGATRAVLERGASILPVGVSASSGSFSAGDVVNVRAASGDVIGRGVARYSSDDMTRVRGIKLDVIGRFLGQDRAQPAVHRDDLLVF